MAFKKVSGAVKYYRYAECQPGQLLVEGTFLGEREGKYGKEYEFRDVSGELVVLNKAGHLDWLMKKHAKPLADGVPCQIYYADRNTLTSGKFAGKEAHRFDLYLDEEGGKPTKVNAKEDDEKAPWEQVESAVTTSDDEIKV